MSESNDAGGASPVAVADLPEQLLWLADAPLFIDAKQVEAFYDAILQPDYEEISRNFSQTVSSETTVGGRLTLGSVLPWFKAEAEVSTSLGEGEGEEHGKTWNRVTNPYRHLLALALRYATEPELRSRLVLAGDGGCVDAAGNGVDLGDERFPQRSPRAMIMLDLQPGTALIPAALELTNGRVVSLYKELADRLERLEGPERSGEPLPEYPRGLGAEAAKARHAYWDWFVRSYDRQTALEVIEDAVKDEPIAWIDYRFPLEGQFPHLHLAGRGLYETGVFGYQMVARGARHGLRIVGTLKSEPDVNVLAVFER